MLLAMLPHPTLHTTLPHWDAFLQSLSCLNKVSKGFRALFLTQIKINQSIKMKILLTGNISYISAKSFTTRRLRNADLE
jgi:hypothetical protein